MPPNQEDLEALRPNLTQIAYVIKRLRREGRDHYGKAISIETVLDDGEKVNVYVCVSEPKPQSKENANEPKFERGGIEADSDDDYPPFTAGTGSPFAPGQASGDPRGPDREVGPGDDGGEDLD